MRRPFGAFSNFIIFLIMGATKHIFPLLLDGDRQVVTDTTDSWNGTSSEMRVDSTSTIAVGSATIEGTLLNIACNTNDDVVINISPDPYGSNNFDGITLTNKGDIATLMWTGSVWIILSSTVGATAVA